MAILFTANDYTRAALSEKVRHFMAGYDLRFWPEIGNPAEVDYIIATGTAPTAHFQNLPNLKAIFLASAGVDAIICDPNLPDVPLVRCVNDTLSQGMAEYVLHYALTFHRNFHRYAAQQNEAVWKQLRGTLNRDRTIGIMGMGEMGMACIRLLQPLGFKLCGWSRTPKQIGGVTHFAGMDQLPDFMAQCDIIACVLPLTDETRGILNAQNLSHLPRGAYLISAGRGAHMVESDIITLLDNGHLAGAALDVFATEPLPADNPLWTHPNVIVTPHIASITDYGALCDTIKQQIANFENGLALENVVDRARGY